MDDESRKGFPKGKIIMIVESSHQGCDMAKLHEMAKRMSEQIEDMKVAMVVLGESGISAALAGASLTDAMNRMHFPLMSPEDAVILPDMDFSHCEKIVLDSLSMTDTMDMRGNTYGAPCYDETRVISKKAWKKLAKNLRKIVNREPKSQKEIWCGHNWNRKIK